jgi:hypothetical protein
MTAERRWRSSVPYKSHALRSPYFRQDAASKPNVFHRLGKHGRGAAMKKLLTLR